MPNRFTVHKGEDYVSDRDAWAEWDALAAAASKIGYAILADDYKPRPGANYAVVDRHAAALRQVLADDGCTFDGSGLPVKRGA